MSDGLFARALAAKAVEDLVAAEGFKLRGSARDKRGQCPLCGSGKTDQSTFKVNTETQKWVCYGSCGLFGDVIDLERELRGGELVDAAKRLAGNDPLPASTRGRPTEKPVREGPSGGDRVALEILREARPAERTLVERYLTGRRVDPDTVARAMPNLRYHPYAKHHWDDHARVWVCAPAMVLQVVVEGPDGSLAATGGAHVTYLDRAGGKSTLQPAKKMWGPQHSADGRPGGAWLIGPAGIGDLIVGEGAESTLSRVDLAQRDGAPRRALAALSLRALQGGVIRDSEGVLVEPVQPDPERPPFTWSSPAVAGWQAVEIALDADMKPVRVKTRTGGRRPRVVDATLDASARARLCGQLAVKAWRAAGARSVRAVSPPPGMDFNDELRRVRALECVT